ncbi:hypothetical protein AAD018_001435 [Aestuariibius insulae]
MSEAHPIAGSPEPTTNHDYDNAEQIVQALVDGTDLQGVINFEGLSNFVELIRPNVDTLQGESLKALVTPGQNVGNTLTNGVLLAGDYLLSDNGQYKVVFQEDGNLVVYNTTTGEATWSSGTHFNAIAGQMVVQSDGNLVVYDYSGEAEWNSETYSSEGNVNRSFTLAMQDDGNLVVYDDPGVALWSSQTGKIGEAAIKSDDWSDLQSLEYIASYTDLMDAYGADSDMGRTHYSSSGEVEGRETTFSSADYLAANPDVDEYFGGDLEAAARHYIDTGRNEGRDIALPEAETAEVDEGTVDSPEHNSGSPNEVNDAAASDLEDRANKLYLKVMDMNMDFQENTAGAKVAKDQSGKVQG